MKRIFLTTACNLFMMVATTGLEYLLAEHTTPPVIIQEVSISNCIINGDVNISTSDINTN